MNKVLILRAFEKARDNLKNKGIKKPSSVEIAEEISDYIDKNESFKLGERSFRDYHNAAQKIKNLDYDINIKQLNVITGLCNYLEFEDYKAFVASLNISSNDKKNSSTFNFIKKNKVTMITSFALITLFIIINSVTKQRWMIWQENHYIEVKFDTKTYNLNQLKLYKEDKIEDFKKVRLDCGYDFFNNDGTVRIWYGKNKNKDLEYFTALGLHPETGKTLNPITEYMITKYICKK